MSLLRIRPLVLSLVRPHPSLSSRWVRSYSVSRPVLISGYGEDPIDQAAPLKKSNKPPTARLVDEAEKEDEGADHLVDEPRTVSHLPGWANPELDRAGLWPDAEEETELAGQPKKKGTKATQPEPDLELGQSKRRFTTSSSRRQEFRRQESPLGEEVKAEARAAKKEAAKDWVEVKESAKENLADAKEAAVESLSSAKLAATDVKEAAKEGAGVAWDKAKKVAKKAKEVAKEATKPIYFKEEDEHP
jgi:hypothetical protein